MSMPSTKFPVAMTTMEGGYDALVLGLSYARTVYGTLMAYEEGWLTSDDIGAARDVLFHGIAYLEAHNEECLREQAAAEASEDRTHG